MSRSFSFAPFEHYMAADDLPSHPMNILWLIEFSGHLDTQRFDVAVEHAIVRHPLFNSILSGSPLHRIQDLRWVEQSSKPKVVRWLTDEWPSIVRAVTPLNIAVERPLRVFARREESGTRVLLQFHHSATDGQGVVAFLEDVFRSYLGEPPVRAFDPRWIKYRHSFGLSGLERLQRLPREVKHASESIFQPAIAVATPKESDQTAPELPFRGAVRMEFSKAELEAAKRYGRERQATLNDLLVFGFFRTLDHWNQIFGGKHRRVRVSVPVNLRPEGAFFPACNLVGMCFLNRSTGIISDTKRLLASIREETQRIRSYRLGLTLVQTITLLSRLRFGKPYNAGGDHRCHATGVLTNLGIVFARTPIAKTEDGRLMLGDGLVLEKVSTFPPIRPNTPLTIGVITYAGRLALCMSYHRQEISHDHAKHFLTTMRDALSDN